MLQAIKAFLVSRTTILDRYLFKQFTGPFLLAVGGFALIGIVDILFYLVELAILSGISFYTILRLLLYKLPAIMILFFPMAVLFSIMLLMVRMAKDNELTVLRTSGVHSGRIVVPLLLLTFLTALISYYTNEKVVPWTNETSDALIRKEIKKKPPPVIRENIVFKDSSDRFFYIKKVNTQTSTMEHVLILEDTSYFPRITSAKKAFWNQLSWTLIDGYTQELSKDGTLEFLDDFDEMTINVEQNIETFYKRQKSAKEMDSKELKERISTLKKGGVSTRGLKVEYYMKTSVPMACFIFGLLGIAYCLSFVRSGKDWWGVIFSIVISVLSVGFYFFIMALFRALAKDAVITPFLGAWIPNMIYGSIAGAITFYQCKYR
jgi:lipopolysaccharide export system permease protein